METMNNQTEQLENAEDLAMQEAESVRIDEKVASQDRKGVIPLVIVQHFATCASKYHSAPGTGQLDTPENAAKHPDVIQIQRDFPGVSLQAATTAAWLLWRARQVEFWTMDLRKNRVTKVQGGADLVQRGTPTHSWDACLDAAYLGKNSQVHELAFARRAKFYEAQAAQRDEWETIALTLKGTDGVQIGAPEDVKRDAQLDQADRQADFRAQRETEEKLEATSAGKFGIFQRRAGRKPRGE